MSRRERPAGGLLAHLSESEGLTVLRLEGRMEDGRPHLVDGLLRDLRKDIPVEIDINGLDRFGSVSVVLLESWIKQLEAHGHRSTIRSSSEVQERLIRAYGRAIPMPQEPQDDRDLVDRLGDQTLAFWDSATAAILVLRSALMHAFLRPFARLDLTLQSLVKMGATAVPLISLITFLIGAILALQAGLLMRLYGQELRIADLVGLSMAKEIAPLLVAILVAGRSGSSLTAEIGTMMVSEEVDALRVMGVDPVEYLVAPRMRALAVALPLLTILGDVIGIAGGMVVAHTTFSVSPQAFLDQVLFQVTTGHVLGGLLKAFFFALVIVAVAAHQGFSTGGGASGVGRRTTRSVVQAILWVILVDALFTAILSAMEWKG
ncbi:MAG TPA: ABC transporter permease [Planctomycetota bacterium]|nr:ABC transporter permease [Planctomycetota bacterium]